MFATHYPGKDATKGKRGGYVLRANVDSSIRVERIGMVRHFTAHPMRWTGADGLERDTLVMRPRDEGERIRSGFDEEARRLREIAAALEPGVPMTCYALCEKLGRPRGRVYERIDGAVPKEGGAVAERSEHSCVRLARDAKGRLVMTAGE